MEKLKRKINRERVIIISLVVAVLISATAYGMSVDNFTDYNPPSTLVLDWGDGGYWTAEYPYRAIFFGGRNVGTGEQKHNSYMWIVYSKKPSTDIFSFEYIASKGTGRNGYIRAQYKKDINPDDIRVYSMNWIGVQSGSVDINAKNFAVYPGLMSSTYSIGDNYYLDFDFYYKCSGSHAKGAVGSVSSLGVSNVTSISSVPYAYILSCDNHSGGGTAESGTGGGGSSSSGSGSSKPPSNSNGNDGNHGWGDGEYGGGVNRDDISSRDDGGGYSSRSDMDLSVPDDWKKPVEDNYDSMPGEYKPEYPEYVPGEYDTGQTGEDWDLPKFSGNDGVTGEIKGYKEFTGDGEQGYIEFNPGISAWGHIEFRADGEHGLIDFMNP